MIKEAYRLFSSTPDECDAKKMLKKFKPLTQGQYPVMDAYPKFVVNYLVSNLQLNLLKNIKIKNFSENCKSFEALLQKGPDLFIFIVLSFDSNMLF